MPHQAPDLVERVTLTPIGSPTDGLLRDFTIPMTDHLTGEDFGGSIAFQILHRPTWNYDVGGKYTWDAGLSSIAVGDTISLWSIRAVGATLHLHAYTAANIASPTDEMTLTMADRVYNTFTLDAAFVAFIQANGDLGDGKFAVRLTLTNDGDDSAYCYEARSILTQPGGGTTHQATASVTALAHGNAAASQTHAAAATNIVAKALKSSANSQLALAASSSATAKAVNTSAIPDVARAVDASVTALATATSADAMMALQAASSVDAKAIVVTAAPDVGAIRAATAHATALATTSGAAAQTALTATASVTAKAVTSGAAAQLSLVAGATNIIAKAIKNTADSTLAVAASATATAKAVVTSAAATTRRALIDGLASIVLVPNENATLFSDTQHWRRL